ncbi:MAG: autotransporter [Treponema sp.]|nr:autotransporter [Treponema sp.]
MKKALGVFLMTAMAFGAFADEPVADVNIAEFSGNAAVQWGVDLDSGTTGFKNSYEVNLKLNLLNNGTKSTTGDGVWGELVLKTEEDTFIGWENGDDSPEMNDEYINANKGLMGSGRNFGLKVYVDTAKIHIGPAYIGIKRGDTQTGKLKMDAAIRSADDDQSVWLTNVGPAKYSEGIVLGVDTEVAKVDLDLRSYAAYSGREDLVYTGTTDPVDPNGHDDERGSYQYTGAYAAALEAELKGEGIGLDGFSAKVGTSFNFAKNYQANKTSADKIDIPETNEHLWGYSASLAYKLGLDDTFYIRPQVGFTGQTMFYNNDDVKTKTTNTTNLAVAAGLLFGWDEIGMDKNAGVYYLDDDMAKKVSPGVGVVAYIPLPNKSTTDIDGNKSSVTTHHTLARIMPSFYTGELIPGLTAAGYADIGVTKLAENDVEGPDTVTYIRKDAKVPMAFALGANYAIPVGDEMTITPKFGVRFANAAYVDYANLMKEKDDPVFGGMGEQKQQGVDKYGITSDGNYMNLKLGVDVAGLVDNTTLSVTWQTENILNDRDDANRNDPKLGTLNFKAKIAL